MVDINKFPRGRSGSWTCAITLRRPPPGPIRNLLKATTIGPIGRARCFSAAAAAGADRRQRIAID